MTSTVLHLEGGEEVMAQANTVTCENGTIFISLHLRGDESDVAIFLKDKAALFRLSNAIARAAGNVT